MTATSQRAPLVEILYFQGCPNHEGALALVEKVAAELGIEAEIRLIDVPNTKSANRLRFLGSPTVRIGERDVEPGGGGADGLRPLLPRVPHRPRVHGPAGRALGEGSAPARGRGSGLKGRSFVA